MHWNLIFKEKTHSTNDDAKELIKSGSVKEDTLIWAQEQVKGRGRFDRVWQGAAGNLFCSFITNNRQGPLLSFVAALAVVQTILEQDKNTQITCRWPNDILINGKKVSGILLEVEGDKMIIGIGMNVRITPEVQSYYKPTSLLEEGMDVKLEKVVNDLSDNLRGGIDRLNMGGFGAIRKEYIKYVQGLGTHIKINTINSSYEGVFKEVSEHGALVLDTKDGLKSIMTGEVFYL